MIRQENARHIQTRQDKRDNESQVMIRQDNALHISTRQDKVRQGKTMHDT